MSTICANSLHCVAINEIKKEMTEMDAKLTTLCSNVQLILQSCQINSSPILMSSVEASQIPSIWKSESPTVTLSTEITSISSTSEVTVKEEATRDSTCEFGISSIKEEILDEDEFLSINAQIPDSNSFSKDTMETEDVMNSNQVDSQSQDQKLMNNICEEEEDLKPSSSHLYHYVSNDRRKAPLHRVKKSSDMGETGTSGYYCKECKKNISTEWRTHVLSVHLQKYSFVCDLCDYGSKSWQLWEIKEHFSNTHLREPFKVTDKRKELITEITKMGDEIIQKPEFNPEEAMTRRIRNPPYSDFLPYKPRYCKPCKKILYKWRSHVASIHLRKPALFCRVCGFESLWEMDKMKKHFSVNHPDQPMNITDKRSELQHEIDEMAQEIIETPNVATQKFAYCKRS